MSKKKRYVQVGLGGRARMFYFAVAGKYSETSELTAFCDLNRTRMELAARLMKEKYDYPTPAFYGMEEFEKIVVRCIVHYNCERVIENYPYSSEMLDANVPPFANKIWNWKLSNQESNLIEVSKKGDMLNFATARKWKIYEARAES